MSYSSFESSGRYLPTIIPDVVKLAVLPTSTRFVLLRDASALSISKFHSIPGSDNDVVRSLIPSTVESSFSISLATAFTFS
jgi:hypothetical protein